MSTSRPVHVQNVGEARKLGSLGVRKVGGLEPNSLIEVYAYDSNLCSKETELL